MMNVELFSRNNVIKYCEKKFNTAFNFKYKILGWKLLESGTKYDLPLRPQHLAQHGGYCR